jgi:tetratricopeptide (TPR) repeat protein
VTLPHDAVIPSGTLLDHFEILDRLGAGGMGEVYHARDARLGRELALKLLPASRVGETDATERFLREARAASALNHPNVITVYDIGQGSRGWYIAMELVRGRTLARFIGTQPDVRMIAGLGAQAARALSVAHDARIVHRDIKPDNLMVRDDGYVKVLDFGLARLFERDGGPDSNSDEWKTGAGLIVGTMRYLAPEQASGEVVAAPTDIFALGVVMYELLTGVHPFARSSTMALLGAIIARDPDPIVERRADLPPLVCTLVHRMLAKEPAMRPTAAEVAATLEAIAGTTVGDAFPESLDAVRLATTPVPPLPSGLTSPAAAAAAQAVTVAWPLADGTTPTMAASTYHPPVTSTGPTIVGRQGDRARLFDAWTQAASGQGQLLGVAGEPGVGKSTFVDACLLELSTRSGIVVARGRCSERLAGTEAFLPILEALESAVRADPSGQVRGLLQRHAPTWFRELADATSVDPTQTSSDQIPQGLQAASPERMKREIMGFIEATARARPFVIFLEDLHWADASTVDLLAYLGSRLDSMPLLVIATYRLTEMRLARHPFLAAHLDLQSRGLGGEIVLDLLDRAHVEELLARRYPGHRFPDAFATLLHAKTEGSPLFLIDLLRWLGSRGEIADFNGAWQLTGTMPSIERDLPPSVRGMIQRKIEQLEESDRKLLMVASVQGFAFDSTIVADVLGLDPADVEERLTTLEKVYAFVRAVEEVDLPDRTPSVRFRFVHVLYQNALFGDIPTSRRVALSGQVASALEARYGARASELAAELAVLWDGARYAAKAAGYYALGAARAAEKFAYVESAELASRGLAQVALLPDGPERTTLEIGLRVSLGFTNVVTRGFHAPETFEQMHRAHELSLEAGRTPQRVPVLWGMVVYHIASGQAPRAFEYGQQMLAIAAETDDQMLHTMAESAMTGAALFRGDLALATASQQRAEALTTPSIRASMRAIVGSDPLMLSRCQAARAHWMSGDLEGARAIFDQSLADARLSRDPRERAHVALHLAEFEIEVGRVEEALRVTSDALRICEEYGVASERLWTAAYLGHAQVRAGDVTTGIATLEGTIAALTMFQCWVSVAEYQGFLAEGYLATGRVADARRSVDEGLAIVARTGEVVWLPELHRIRARVHLAGSESAHELAAADLRKAVAHATAQGATLFAKRAERALLALTDAS